MHVFPKDTHPLSLSLGPMGDISVHASVAAHDTTLDNGNNHYARHVPRNIVSIRRAILPSKWYIQLITHSLSMHITLVTINTSE